MNLTHVSLRVCGENMIPNNSRMLFLLEDLYLVRTSILPAGCLFKYMLIDIE